MLVVDDNLLSSDVADPSDRSGLRLPRLDRPGRRLPRSDSSGSISPMPVGTTTDQPKSQPFSGKIVKIDDPSGHSSNETRDDHNHQRERCEHRGYILLVAAFSRAVRVVRSRYGMGTRSGSFLITKSAVSHKARAGRPMGPSKPSVIGKATREYSLPGRRLKS